MSRRVIQVGGLAAAAGVGYYMYQAGGDPKAAQKRAEADATKLSNDVQNNLPGSTKEAKKDAEVAGQDMRSQADKMAKDAREQVDKVDAKLDAYRRDAKQELDKAAKNTESSLNNAVDKFDKSVSEGANKAKSGISSWFGGGK